MEENVFTLENLISQKVTGFGFTYTGDLSKTETKLKYITGFTTYFENGMKMINGGGARTGQDYLEFYVLNEQNEVIYENEYAL